jgi:hypothetical protein
MCIDPNKINRVILNQVNFADSCDFNNVNVFVVPYFTIIDDESYPQFLSNNFKLRIKDLVLNKKMLSHEVVPRDPIYVAFDLGYSGNLIDKSIYTNTKLEIVRKKDIVVNKDIIKKHVTTAILNFFDSSNNQLGETIDLTQLTLDILSIEGVNSLRTVNTEENSTFHGLSFITWNPLFEAVDVSIVNQSITLPYFKFPYFYRPNNLINKIDIIDE